ncbi:MAG: NHL repeat-containing protein [Nitrospirae bacterium]|nr:NHL repeat-containing protein [Nitrospirota bacterium]
MRRIIIYNLPMVPRVILAGIFSFIFLILSAIVTDPAFGIRLTYVKHLFDITHDFSQPSDVSVSKDGHIYVVDGVNNVIKVFNQSGKFVYSFGSKGPLNGQFKFPLGIDVSSSGKVYVADSGNHRIQIFGPTGNYLNQIKLHSKIKPADPTDVAANESLNRLYVADNDNHYILVYDLSNMQLLQTLGAPGIEEREFRYPFQLAFDNHKYIYITDVVNTRVQVFNPDGQFVTVIGGWGVEKGQFFRPKGVAVDKNNRVYVSDSYMGVIQVFKNNGEFYSAIGDPEKNSVKKFVTPAGLFIDNNLLFVVEMFADKISVYKIAGDTE